MANTEIQYVKKKITKLETDFAAFASRLIEAGIVGVGEENGERVFRVKKVKTDG